MGIQQSLYTHSQYDPETPSHSEAESQGSFINDPTTIKDAYFRTPSKPQTPASEKVTTEEASTEEATEEASTSTEQRPSVDQPTDDDDNVAEAIARICTNAIGKSSTLAVDKNVPDVYVITVDSKILGYKASWREMKRTVDQIMTNMLSEVPLGSHKYWWSKPKTISNYSHRYTLFAQPYNNLINYPSVAATITVQRIPYVHKLNVSCEPVPWVKSKVRYQVDHTN